MKHKALAIVLAICMVLSMLPVTAFAAPVGKTAQISAQPRSAVTPAALPELPAEINSGDYKITARVEEEYNNGEIMLYASSADAQEIVYMMVDPDPGYLPGFNGGYSYSEYDIEIRYVGLNLYEIKMPDGDVEFVIGFYPAEGRSHSVTVSAPDYCSWALVDDVTSAKEGESVFLVVQEKEGYRIIPETDVGSNCSDFYYMGTLDEEGKLHIYELLMPNHDVKISIYPSPPPQPREVYFEIVNKSLGSWGTEPGTTTMPGDTVTIYAEPLAGCRVEDIYIQDGTELKSIGNHRYTFVMPDWDVLVYIAFAENINPVTVTVETGLGGTAFADVTEAQEGDTVTVVCTPEEGYHIAQISGVPDLTDNGNGAFTFTMPGTAVDIQVLFLRNENPFLDVNETHFFYDPVLWAVENGITSGMTPDTFGPFSVCNRAQVITFLWRAAGSPAPESTVNPFTDVPEGSFYYDAVLWAVENGITNGISADEFGPDLACNRAQVVTFLWRAAGQPEPETTENPFEDTHESDFYYKAVLWARENGITTGATATTFNPGGECQRAQVVTFLYRVDQLPASEPTAA